MSSCESLQYKTFLPHSHLNCSVFSTFSVVQCLFYGLNSNKDGGAIFSESPEVSIRLSLSYFVQCEAPSRGGGIFCDAARAFDMKRCCSLRCHANDLGQVCWARVIDQDGSHTLLDNACSFCSYKLPSRHNIYRMSEGNIQYDRNNASDCLIGIHSGVYFAENTVVTAIHNTISENKLGGLVFLSTKSGIMSYSNLVNNSCNNDIRSYFYRQYVNGEFTVERCLFLDNRNFSEVVGYWASGETFFNDCIFNTLPLPVGVEIQSTSSHKLDHHLLIKCKDGSLLTNVFSNTITVAPRRYVQFYALSLLLQ